MFGLAGLAGIAGISVLLTRPGQSEPAGKEYIYIYNVQADLTGCKIWKYVEPNPYNVTLYNGDIIKINLTITADDPIDIVEHRFYHFCNAAQDISVGRFYAYVNGRPAVPTVGIVNSPVPLYFAAPKCPNWGVIGTAIWDTDDTRMPGYVEYTYLYQGDVPVSIKTIELYVTKGG